MISAVYNFFNLNIILPDARNDWAEPWQLLFQDPASPIYEGIVNLHHDIMFILFFVAIFVITVMAYIVFYFNDQR